MLKLSVCVFCFQPLGPSQGRTENCLYGGFTQYSTAQAFMSQNSPTM